MKVQILLSPNQVIHVNGVPATIDSIGGALVLVEAGNVPLMFQEGATQKQPSDSDLSELEKRTHLERDDKWCEVLKQAVSRL